MRLHNAVTFAAALATLSGCSHAAATTPPALPALASARNVSPLTNGDGYETLHIFAGGRGDGAYPNGGVISANGTLYGTTAGGGFAGEGTAYESSLSGNVFVIHAFGNSLTNGLNPDAPVTMVNGALYGTTESGDYGDAGTIYKIANGFESTIDYFYPSSDGANPYDGLLLVGSALYGTAFGGGAYGNGTVFAIDPAGYGFPTVVYSFGAASGDGANPMAALIYDNGTFYGTTYNGGANNEGTVFALTPSGTERVLHSFGSSGDGANPRGAFLRLGRSFYGTTVYGGTSGDGTVYAISKSGHETVLHSFSGPPDGAGPYDQLTAYHGALYGTTYDGGSGGCDSENGCGTIFKITRTGSESVLHNFTSNPDGAHPWAGLVMAKGGMYGTATLGGSGYGTIFRIAR
jgi:uncharacterized repeat protein (TIGR03803 family)